MDRSHHVSLLQEYLSETGEGSSRKGGATSTTRLWYHASNREKLTHIHGWSTRRQTARPTPGNFALRAGAAAR